MAADPAFSEMRSFFSRTRYRHNFFALTRQLRKRKLSRRDSEFPRERHQQRSLFARKSSPAYFQW